MSEPRGHTHTHSPLTGSERELLGSRDGTRALGISFALLAVTAVFQVFVVLASGSVALLGDTIHNFADALTAVPLWIAFSLARRAPSKRFTYGLGRAEDLAGLAVVAVVFGSAIVVGWEAITRLLNPRPVEALGAVALAAVVGVLGNELAARVRISTGRRIGSAALVADGQHSRVDALTSGAVLMSVLGSWLGLRFVDPVIGLVIAAVILALAVDSGREVVSRMLEGVSPEVIERMKTVAGEVPEVLDVTRVRARWLGHGLLAEADVTVDASLPARESHDLAIEVRHGLLHNIEFLTDVTVHVDPSSASGAEHHGAHAHEHDGSAPHDHT